MKLRHPLLLRVESALAASLVKCVAGTCRYHFRYADPNVNPEFVRRTGQRYIYAFFHEVMIFPAYFWAWPEMQILIGEHHDGELVAQVVRRLGFGVVRGSTTRNGARALREMQHRVERGHLCVTPDGPKGPRRHVHQGLAYLSSRTGLPIVGAGMAFRNAWHLNSWDRFAIPHPFTAAACVAAEPLLVPPDADRTTIETFRLEVEHRMQSAIREAEQWVQHL